MNKHGLLILVLLAGISPARADIRVLFAFDEDGHRAHKVVSLPSRAHLTQRADDALATGRSKSVNNPLSLSPLDAGRAVHLQRQGGLQGKSLTSRLTEHVDSNQFSELYWYDEQGDLIATTYAPDPRVARAPGHIEGAAESMVTLSKGAWLATGPDAATYVQVFLPERSTPVLGSEQWHIDLTRD